MHQSKLEPVLDAEVVDASVGGAPSRIQLQPATRSLLASPEHTGARVQVDLSAATASIQPAFGAMLPEPSWGKPSKKSSLEDDIPEPEQLDFVQQGSNATSAARIPFIPPDIPAVNHSISSTHTHSQPATASVDNNNSSLLDETQQQVESPAAISQNAAIITANDPGLVSSDTDVTSNRETTNCQATQQQASTGSSVDQQTGIPPAMPATTFISNANNTAPTSNSAAPSLPEMSEDEQLRHILELSQQEEQERQRRQQEEHQNPDALVMNADQIEEARTAARELEYASSNASVDWEVLSSLWESCKQEEQNIQRSIEKIVVAPTQDETQLTVLLEVLDHLNHAMQMGHRALEHVTASQQTDGQNEESTSSPDATQPVSSPTSASILPVAGDSEQSTVGGDGTSNSFSTTRETTGLHTSTTGSSSHSTSTTPAGAHRPPSYRESSSLDVERLVEKKDIFTLICTLRAQQHYRRREASLALMRFARAAYNDSEEDKILLEEIRSSGGMHSLLTLFRTRGCLYDIRVVAALAVSYVLPSFFESSTPNPVLALKIVECIRFLGSCRPVLTGGEDIAVTETLRGATVGLTAFWLNYLGPTLNSKEGSLAIVAVEKATFTGNVFDQRSDDVALRELFKETVALIVDVAKKVTNEHDFQGSTLTLVEHVTAVDIARPVAVRQGILEVLVTWLQCKADEQIYAATMSMRSLTSIQDKYMAGWIHSEMVNKGAVKALSDLTRDQRFISQSKVRVAICQILASLCVAPHTRAAVVEAKCMPFLIGFLYDSTQFSEDVILSASTALVQLAVGAITRAKVGDNFVESEGFGGASDVANELVRYVLLCVFHIRLVDGETYLTCIRVFSDLADGAIAPFVSIARTRQGNLRSIAIEALRVISEDVSPVRQTRLLLCEGGAASALGFSLQEDSKLVTDKRTWDRAFMSLSPDDLKRLHHSVCALANILDPVQDSAKSVRMGVGADPLPRLLQGCIDTARDGGLDAMLKIASIPFRELNLRESQGMQGASMDLLEEACTSLSTMAPLLLTSSLAEAGLSKGAHFVLTVLHGVLKQLNNAVGNRGFNVDGDRGRSVRLRDVVLTGLSVLAKSDPFKIRIFDRILPSLVHAVDIQDTKEASDLVSQALQSIDYTEDEIALQVAGNKPGLVADWFCLRRSLVIQSIVRAEVRQIIINTWGILFSEIESPGLTNLIRYSSDRARSDDGMHSLDFFDSFADEEVTMERRERLVQAYVDIYGQGDSRIEEEAAKPPSLRSRVESTGGDEGLLSEQMYPLNSSQAEMDWVLDHHQFMQTALTHDGAKSDLHLPVHTGILLETCFPSRLLRDRLLPVADLRPDVSFSFRGLMMPQRNYFSFRREGKLLSRICDKEAALFDDSTHWTLGFKNSTFDGEFAESLVQLLYLCPMINGLSFSTDSKLENAESSRSNGDNQGDRTIGLLASLAGSLPPWITYLTFDGALHEQDVATLVSILETVGKLSTGEDPSSSGSEAGSASQGKFSFLAIRRSPFISADIWNKFFGLFYTKGSVNSSRPLSSLKSLDLSFNGLGDELCATILKIVYEEPHCCLEELDLSGNRIRNGSKFIRELGKRGKRSNRSSQLHTLVLASNDLGVVDAWYEILTILQSETLKLRSLDISSNSISLSEYSKTATIVQLISSNTNLVRLNLSRNKFDAGAVGDFIRQLQDDTFARDCTLGFLELRENDPPLTPEHKAGLHSFLTRSRRNLLKRRIAEREKRESETATVDSPSQGASGTVEDQAPDEMIPEDDTVMGDASDIMSIVSNDHHDVAPSGNLITVLFSAPLVFKDNQQTFKPFRKLNFEMERELIWQCLKEASRDIELSFDNATHDRLLATITKRCSCLHYSGHGHMNHLPFEDGTGGTKWFPVDQFKKLIENDRNVAPFRFVFVSACYSGLAGETFASAGVPHVVCCQQEYELKDNAALAFTRQFYLSLAVGNTVREAFEQGCKAVRATPNLIDAEEEMKKFILLPVDGNHDVPIFNAKPVREWPRALSEEARRLRRSGARRVPAARTSELVLRNLLQDDPAPAPPQAYLGREVEMYLILKQILSEKKLVSVIGPPGIGRSSVVCGVCHYINERKNIMAHTIEKIYFVSAKAYHKKNRFVALVRQLYKKLVDDGTCHRDEDDDGDVESTIDSICHGLKNVKALVVFDHVEVLNDSADSLLNEFPMLIRELCRETNHIKIILTNARPLAIPSLGEHPISLGPLNFASTVKLFAHMCPYIHTPADRRQLSESLVTPKNAELLPTDEAVDAETDIVFDKLGRGIPSRVENAAFCIHKDVLASLRDGSFRDEM